MTRIAGLALSVAAAGCSFHAAGNGNNLGSDATIDGANRDADSIDAHSIDAMLGPCIAAPDLGIDLCPMDAPGLGLELTSSTTLHTDDGTTNPSNAAISCAKMMGGSNPDVCAIYVTTIQIDAGVTLSAYGGKPLALLATGSIDIEGMVDVASHIGGQVGAAAPHAGCSDGTNPNNEGGGQGGSYATVGGNGGDADNAANSGGIAGATLTITSLGAGCPGANGDDGGAGGPGGGAVFIATPTLTIGNAGQVDASGAAARGANAGKHGGGGGGSGGLIAITAGSISLIGNAQLYANGSHGGGGSASSSAGNDGSDPTSAASGGANGSGGAAGGNGAVGAVRGVVAGNGAAGSAGNDGGGGGGGGAGAIYIRPASATITNNTNVSPTPI